MSMSAASLAVVLATIGCLLGGLAALSQRRQFVAPGFLFAAATLGMMLGWRWAEFGQGPFITLFDVLASGIFGLSLLFGSACLATTQVRAAAPSVAAVLAVMGLWALTQDQGRVALPATYGNPWLWVHVLFGKLFLGAALIASGLAASLWIRGARSRVIVDTRLLSAWQWLLVALVLHTAMLVSGAVWAQDAWGRYWDWDPLETWAFATWLAMVFALHARVGMRLSPMAQQALIVGVFVLAFLTFFGVPFVSIAPHKGAV